MTPPPERAYEPSAAGTAVPERGSASLPITSHTACTGAPPIDQRRCGEDESNAIDPPGPNSYSSNPTRTPSLPADDVAVLVTAVRHECVLRARRRTDRVGDVEKLDVPVAVGGQSLPADAGGEVDDPPRLRPFGQAVAAPSWRTTRSPTAASPKTSLIVIPSSVTSAYKVLTDGFTRRARSARRGSARRRRGAQARGG